MSESIQQVLTRLRPPRVMITYDVEIGDAIVKKELPFIMGIMSDLSGDTVLADLEDKKFIYIDPDNFMDVMKGYNPTLGFSVKNYLDPNVDAESSNIRVNLRFQDIEDFKPDNLIAQVPEMLAVYGNRLHLVSLLAVLDGNSSLETVLFNIIADDSLKQMILDGNNDKINALIEQGRMIKTEDQRAFAQELLIAFAHQIGDKKDIQSVSQFVMNEIAAIDKRLSLQTDAILHHQKFQILEGRWLGLYQLITHLEMSDSLRVRVLSTTKTEILNDLNRAMSFDQSKIFKKIYEEEFDTFGGLPYSVMVADFMTFDRTTPSLDVLEKLTTVCAAAHVPLLTSASPELFNWSDYASLAKPRDLAKLFDTVELARWNAFRTTEDARYCSMFLPHVLMRSPYDVVNNPIMKFNYTEAVNGDNNGHFCWGNPAYHMAIKIGQAYAMYHWTANIRGVEGGGLVENLPLYTYKSSDGDVILKCPTLVTITDRREKELSDLGFIAICHAKGKNFATFFGGQTLQKALVYNKDDASANAALSARLPYMLNASRFAHYIKMMMRDKIGSMMSAAEVQDYIQAWLADYVLLSDTASQALKASMPLRNADVSVVDVPGKPGSYKAIIHLQPHFQVEDIDVSIRLVASLGESA